MGLVMLISILSFYLYNILYKRLMIYIYIFYIIFMKYSEIMYKNRIIKNIKSLIVICIFLYLIYQIPIKISIILKY